MPVSYRLMNPAEEPAVLSLWSSVFNLPYVQEQQRFSSDPHRYQTTFVAVAAAVGDEAGRRGLVYGEVELPHEAPVDAVIADLFGASLHLSDANTRIMIRPINAGFRAEQLQATFQAPNAFYSGIDHF